MRALRRTALFLLVLSSVRWVADRPTPPALPSGEVPIDQLIDSSRGAADELSARSRPLAPGERLDPNAASSIDFDRLPGIGAGTAAEIVADRELHGPFGVVEDLTRVSGVGPGTLAKIGPFLALGANPVRGRAAPPPVRRPRRSASSRIDLNRADSIALTGLSGIGPALASRILAERRKQLFRSVDDLARVRGVGPSTVERLRAQARVGRRP